MRSRYYCCLLLRVVMVMSQDHVGCLENAITDMNDLRKEVGDGGDICLYAPDVDDIYLQECGKETMECFQNELSVLDFEFDGTRKQKQNVSKLISQLNKNIKHIISRLNATRGCRQCEIYHEESASTFFTNLEAYLQYQNRHICPTLWN